LECTLLDPKAEFYCSELERWSTKEMASRDGLTLRKRALEALEKSTKMLDVAFDLLKQGNQSEADRVRNDARTQRTISTLLMAEANRLEIDPKTLRHSNTGDLPRQSHDTSSATH
jgi:hypothetical protein